MKTLMFMQRIHKTIENITTAVWTKTRIELTAEEWELLRKTSVAMVLAKHGISENDVACVVVETDEKD